ncbi:tubulin binding cofactor C-domain-containing protein [Umbelopsis sp. PMI_123]|nr:tubulin binding cofactor C-domain-containing protein [Umbelopsis sp. PMI_123]
MDSTAAAAKFYTEFQLEKDEIQEQLSRSNEIDKTHLEQRFESLLARINSLERKLTESTTFVPGYDQRQFSLALRTLKDNLAAERSKLTPRTKFSFKSRTKKTATATNTKQAEPADANIAASAITSNVIEKNTIKFTDVEDSFLTLPEHNDQIAIGVSISNVKRCIIRLDENQHDISAVHIKDIEQCVIIAGRVSGSILIYGCKRSIILAECHQFRMHDSATVKLLLSVSSHPIMEDSRDIVIGSYNTQSALSHDNASERMKRAKNYYDHMDDFNWLKQQASPNWRLMDPSTASKASQSIMQLEASTAKEMAANTELDLYKDLFPM